LRNRKNVNKPKSPTLNYRKTQRQFGCECKLKTVKFLVLSLARNVEIAHVALIYNGKSADPLARFDWLRVTPQNGK
jgi:hypothetical protein